MLKIIFTPPRSEADLERHARFLHEEALEKAKLPRVSAATRALVPTWCDSCSERCWGAGSFALCTKCRGEGKLPLGFSLPV